MFFYRPRSLNEDGHKIYSCCAGLRRRYLVFESSLPVTIERMATERTTADGERKKKWDETLSTNDAGDGTDIWNGGFYGRRVEPTITRESSHHHESHNNATHSQNNTSFRRIRCISLFASALVVCILQSLNNNVLFFLAQIIK